MGVARSYSWAPGYISCALKISGGHFLLSHSFAGDGKKKRVAQKVRQSSGIEPIVCDARSLYYHN